MRRQSSSSLGTRNEPIQRVSSDAGTSSTGGSAARMWRLGSALKKLQGISSSSKEDKTAARSSIQQHRHGPSSDCVAREHSISEEKESMHEAAETSASHGQLHALMAHIRTLSAGPGNIDAAYKEFSKIREQCASLCQAIVRDELKSCRLLSPTTDAPRSQGPTLSDQRSSFSGLSLAEVVTGSGSRGYGGDAWLIPIREWKNFLESLVQSFKTYLAETYKSYEREATPEMVEALFASKKFRKDAVLRMRNASVTKIMSADPQFFPRYEIHFRNYEKVKQELMDMRRLLQAGESGIAPDRTILDVTIAPGGDVVLEFANLAPKPVLRFRVSSTALADTSPIFARMFGGQPSSHYVHEAEDISVQLPPPPAQYFCEDESEVRLFRMPQLELNKLDSLEILLHAAHGHGEELERDISFEQFVAVAECCMRYRCTAPLEAVVEHRWLPQWMHKGADDMPDGLLIISYAFGLRQLFARTSKRALLHLVDERDLESKPWPQRIKDKLWAVRCAKVDQLYASCVSVIQDYLRPPTLDPGEVDKPVSMAELESRLSSTTLSPSSSLLASSRASPASGLLSSTPRCPRGCHWCDACNLGWMMLIYNEMGLLPHVLRQDAIPPASPPPMPSRPRSLAQMMDMLRLVPSPPRPVHPGSVCDPAPPFRAAIADVYNSVMGLTLHDISGKSHGWALSKNRSSEPQTSTSSGLGRMATQDVHSVVTELSESVLVRILTEMRDPRSLHAAARINRAFYRAYKRNEMPLMKNMLRAGRILESGAGHEGKVLKSESDRLKERGFGEGADVVTLRSEDEYDEEGGDEDEGVGGNGGGQGDDEDDDDDGEMSDSSDVTVQNDDFDLLRDPPPPFRPRDADPPPPAPPQTTGRQDWPLDCDGYEPPMTDEEARRILWPDHVEGPAKSEGIKSVRPVEGLREKYRVGDVCFTEGLEAKTLVSRGDGKGGGKARGGLSKEELLGSVLP